MKNMIFNFSRDNQFTTEIELNGDIVETVSETKLLGTIITDKLDWNKNTNNIVKEANKRMSFLHKSSKFATNRHDLKKIFVGKALPLQPDFGFGVKVLLLIWLR